VDDDEVLTALICDYFRYSESGIIPITTNDPEQVFPLLEKHKDIRLVLSDFRMPGINGLELLLRVKDKYPQMLFIIMSAFASKELKQLGLKKGAIRYIEKPINLLSLSEIITEELQERKSGFGGIMEAVHLPDIIQMIGMSRRTVDLNVFAENARGRIAFLNGEVIHSVSENSAGEKAFYEILNWPAGRFALTEPAGKDKRTIFQSWQALLLDAARMRDEAKVGLDAHSRAEDELYDFEESTEIVSAGETLELKTDISVSEAKILDYDHLRPLPLAESSFKILKSEFDQLYDDLIGDLYHQALRTFFRSWPDQTGELYFTALPLNRLPVHLRRYFFFIFHYYWTLLLQKNETPFDFKNENVAKALQNLLLSLRKNWILSAELYKEILSEALRLEITQYLNPTKSLALYLLKQSQGNMEILISILQLLLENKLLDSAYQFLIEDLKLLNINQIKLKKLETYLNTIQEGQTTEANINELISDFKKLLLLIQNSKASGLELNFKEIITLMLNSRSLGRYLEPFSSNLEQIKPPASGEQILELLENLKAC
jgi:DNA-binding response OmpR family regulator